jgi:phenylacetate-CoA ligase
MLDPQVVDRLAAELVARNAWSRERLVEFQKRKLRKALQHAVAACPYYRDLIGEQVTRNAPLADLPTTTKAMLMQNFDCIVTDPRLTRALVERHLDSYDVNEPLLGEFRVAATGGSTGERGVFVYDRKGWESATANLVRFLRLIGVFPTTRSVGVGASSPIHLTNRFYAELRAGRADAPRLSVTMPIEEVVVALNGYQPEVLSTYPSFLRLLAEEQRAGRLHIAPRLIRSVAETLTPEVRAMAHEVWHIPLINGYACTEIGVMGQECEEAEGIHLAEDLFVLEVVDDAGRPVPAGVQGAKVLVTSLANDVLPIIRYELSDIVTMAEGPCRCGSPFARIADIQGRREEFLQVPSEAGESIAVHAGRLRSPLLLIAGIRQYQFGQLADVIRIVIAPAMGCDPAEVSRSAERAVRNVLAQMDAGAARVEVDLVDKIDRIGSGAKEKLIASPRR